MNDLGIAWGAGEDGGALFTSTGRCRAARWGTYRADPRYCLGLADEVAARAAWVHDRREGRATCEPPRPGRGADEVPYRNGARRVAADPARRAAWAAAHARLCHALGRLPTRGELADDRGVTRGHAGDMARDCRLPLTAVACPRGLQVGFRPQRVLAALGRSGPLTTLALADRLGLSRRRASEVTATLVKSGHVVHVGWEDGPWRRVRLYAAVSALDKGPS